MNDAPRNGRHERESPSAGTFSDFPKPVLCHIGLPKAASTTLQYVLARDGRLAYFGPNEAGGVGLERALVDPLIFGDESTFRARSPAAARHIRESAAHRPAIVLSDEVLTWGQHAKRAQEWPLAEPIPPTRTATRLAEICPEATILVIFRGQIEWICSHFLQMKYINAMDETFDRFLEQGVRPNHFYSFESVIDYVALHDAYVRAFGEARVKPVFFEEIIEDIPRFVANLYAWLGVDPPRHAADVPKLNTRTRVHPAVRAAAARVAPLARVKARAPGVFRAVKGMMPGQPRDIPLTPVQRQMIVDRYAPSNQRLAARLGRPLPSNYPGSGS